MGGIAQTAGVGGPYQAGQHTIPLHYGNCRIQCCWTLDLVEQVS